MYNLGGRENNLGRLVSLSAELAISNESNDVADVVEGQQEEHDSQCSSYVLRSITATSHVEARLVLDMLVV